MALRSVMAHVVGLAASNGEVKPAHLRVGCRGRACAACGDALEGFVLGQLLADVHAVGQPFSGQPRSQHHALKPWLAGCNAQAEARHLGRRVHRAQGAQGARRLAG